MGIRSTLKHLGIGRPGTWPDHVRFAVILVIPGALTVFFVFLMLQLAQPQLAPLLPLRRSSDWVEVSRGELLRAVRHVPTGRCFVRYAEGGIVETDIDVCRPSR